MITAEEASRLPIMLHHLHTLGKHNVYHDTLSSTQDKLVECASTVPDGTVMIAHRQTRGRGRMGRKWVSPPGTLVFSVVMRPALPPPIVGTLMLAASVSLHESIRQYVPHASLKWPNDIIIDNLKVAGTLLDVSITDKVQWVVVGVGINISNEPSAVAEELQSDATFGGTTNVAMYNRSVSGLGVLSSFLTEMDLHYTEINRGNYAQIPSVYEKRCSTIGRVGRFQNAEGTAKGVGPDGSLLVQSSDGLQHITLCH